MKITQDVLVKNDMGLHARPAAVIAKLLQNCQSKVVFNFNMKTVDAKSPMNTLLLAAGKNAQITITADGVDARETMNRLIKAFSNRFGEGKN